MKKDFNLMNNISKSAAMVEKTALNQKQTRTKKTNPASKKISLNLTIEEYEKIRDLSDKELLSLSNFVRKVLYDSQIL